MDWTAFTSVNLNTKVSDILLVVLPVAIGVFAIFLGLRYSKKIFGLFVDVPDEKEPWESYDIWTEDFDKDQMDKYYDHHIKPHI